MRREPTKHQNIGTKNPNGALIYYIYVYIHIYTRQTQYQTWK